MGDARPRRRRLLVGALAAVLVVAGCAGEDGPDRADPAPPATHDPAAPGEGRGCDQGFSVEEVRSTPVEGVEHDHTVTSFDGTELRVHWFPADDATPDDPRPTVLMGPGWSLPGDTSEEGAALFGALGIGPMNERGYNVLTWDPRGFGESTGVVQINSPDHEGRDVQVLLDWVAERPEALTDREGDPRAGMVGFSYGGGIQLVVAAIDCRVDAIVPGLAWHSLETSLYRSGLVKTGWAQVLIDAGTAAGEVDPHAVSAYESGVERGTLSEEDLEWFRARGPAELVEQVRVPTLLVHGTVDTLFTVDEVVTNFEVLDGNDVPVATLWICGGHGTCRTEGGDESRVAERTFAWLDRYLKGDEDVDTGARVEVVDQDGTTWVGDELPPPEAEPLEGEGSGTLELSERSVSALTEPPPEPEVLDTLVWRITPDVAEVAVDVPIEAPGEATLVLGAPRLRLTYRGEVAEGERPVRVFAQLVDDERSVVVGNQVTPIPLELDGGEHTTEVELETVLQHLDAGETLRLQIVATATAYATPRLGGSVTFERIEVSLPTTEALTRAD